MIQLTGSAPCVSNFVEYSGVVTVIVRFGAAVKFVATTGVDVVGFALAVGVAGEALAVADGLGNAPGCAFWIFFTGGKNQLHKRRIVDERIKASRTRFWFIL